MSAQLEKLFVFCFPNIPPIITSHLIEKWDTSDSEDLALKSAKAHFSSLYNSPEGRRSIVEFCERESLAYSDLPFLVQYPLLFLDVLESSLMQKKPMNNRVTMVTSDDNGLKFEIFEEAVYQMTHFRDEEELVSSAVRLIEMAFTYGFERGSVNISHKDIGLVYNHFRRIRTHFKPLGWLFEHQRLFPMADLEQKGVHVSVKYLMPDSALMWIEIK